MSNAGKRNRKPTVAYFCMEYGLQNDFRIYSGGLGILAGDLIKAAKDLDYPMVAVGILWRQGYTSQTIGPNGYPVDAYGEYRYDFLKDTGVEVSVRIREADVKLKVWLCDCFGNIPLYLLDAYIPGNPAFLVTGQLYGWFEEERLAQEIILGVGGVRALKALKIKPDVYHFNEGHAVLAAFEMIQHEMDQKGLAFKDAWDAVRRNIVFTTHTPVVAGNEVHPYPAMFYMGANCGFGKRELRLIGGEPFNMTVAGLKLSYKANAVAKLHAETANRMWADVKPPSCGTIIAVTNGVHNGTWQDPGLDEAAQQGGEGGDMRLWDLHQEAKYRLMKAIEDRNHVRFDPDRLTIGFARRAAPYKRSDLIFTDKEKIFGLLDSGKLQLVFSGKAHPNDYIGKGIVKNLAEMAYLHPQNVTFLQNYDMEVGQLLTRGCDVWLNNPIRPMEASGTSGMKAAMNGVLNLSVLDGWWPEGCEHGVNGWQIGDAYEGEDQDEHDAAALYKVLEGEVIPTYYEDRAKWVSMMRASIAMSRRQFSAARMLEDYAKGMYAAWPGKAKA